jgi:hypothetical protein
MIDDTAELPPFLPMLVTYSYPVFLSSSFEDSAETNPTGKATISAGVTNFATVNI